MKPTLTPIATQPERMAPGGSPRPRAWPTLTEAAEETPRGTMNETHVMFSTTS